MGRGLVWTLGLIGLIVLTLLCVNSHRAEIEQDLGLRASDALLSAGFPELSVSAEGRDLSLLGPRPADPAAALKAAKVYGVRVVRDEMNASSTPTAGPSADSTASTEEAGTAVADPQPWNLIGARDDSGAFAWRGALASSGISRLHEASARWLGDGTSTALNETLEDGSAAGEPNEAQERLVLAALPFLSVLQDATLEASPEKLVLRGSPASLAEAQTVLATLKPLVPEGTTLDLQWNRQWDPAELRLEAVSRTGGWRLSGLVPNGSRAGWLEAMRDSGLEPFEDRLIEGDVVAPPDFGKGFKAGLPVLGQAGSPLESARWVEAGGTWELTGLSDDSALGDRLQELMKARLPAGSAVNYGVTRRLAKDDCQQSLSDALSSEKIRFDSGSARIGPESKPLLELLASTLRRCPGSTVIVEGHTDSDGSDAFNQVLSTRRADAVYRRLVSLGVEATRLTAVGYGESRPLVLGNDPEAKRQNRRIELNIEEDK